MPGRRITSTPIKPEHDHAEAARRHLLVQQPDREQRGPGRHGEFEREHRRERQHGERQRPGILRGVVNGVAQKIEPHAARQRVDAQFRAHRQQDRAAPAARRRCGWPEFRKCSSRASDSSRIDTAMTENESSAPTIQRTTRASLLVVTGWFGCLREGEARAWSSRPCGLPSLRIRLVFGPRLVEGRQLQTGGVDRDDFRETCRAAPSAAAR